MTKTQFRLGVAAIFAAVLLFNLTSPNRFSFDGEGLVIDGVTGTVYKYNGEGKGWEALE